MSRLLILLTLAVACVSLVACDIGGGGSDGKPQIRLLNVSTGYTPLDLYTNDEDDDNDSDQAQISGVATDTTSDFKSLDASTYTVKFKRASVTSTLTTGSGKKLVAGEHMTYVAFGSSGNFGVLELREDNEAPDSGKSKLTVINTAEAGALNVYLTDSTTDLEDASPNFSSIASGAVSSLTTLDSGTYRLRVTGAGDTTDLRLDVASIDLASKGISTIILTATQGGVLVNALAFPQQGSLTKYTNTKARVRGAVGIPSGTAVIATVGGKTILSNSAVGVIGNYTQIDAGSATVGIRVDGVIAPAASRTLVAGGDYTLLIWGDSGGTQTTLVEDDNRAPSASGKAKVRVINGLSTLAVPVTLQLNYSPLAEDIALGDASEHEEVDSGTDYQLDAVNTSSGGTLVSKTSVTLTSGGVYSMFVWGSGVTVGSTLRKDR
jgi:hypothetical protein